MRTSTKVRSSKSTTVLVIIVTCGMLYLYEAARPVSPAAAALSRDQVTGANYTCSGLKWFGAVYRDCYVTVQPGTTRDVKTLIDFYGPATAAVIAGAVAAMCALIGGPAAPFVAVLCAGLAGIGWAYVKQAIDEAARLGNCLRIEWREVVGIPFPAGAQFYSYGRPQTWVGHWVNHGRYADYEAFWEAPDRSCQTRNTYACPAAFAPWHPASVCNPNYA